MCWLQTQSTRYRHTRQRAVLNSDGCSPQRGRGPPKGWGCTCNTLYPTRDAGHTGVIIFFTFLKMYLSHIYLFGCARSVSLAHTMACGIQFPDQGSNPGPSIGSMES